MGKKAKDKGKNLFIGVDVGGTKILAALVKPSGKIVARSRLSTPRGENAGQEALFAVIDLIKSLMDEKGVTRKSLAAIGIGVPGVVDVDEGRVVRTPNMSLSGMDLAPRLEEEFGVPVALGNDVNLGTLGEKWLGAARYASSAVGIFVGTGIGAGVILDGQLVRGSREVAGEVGHMVMQIGGPLCGCGNRGCLEALASRSAIERDIREAVAAGKKTLLTKIVGKDLRVIRSRMLSRALQEGDELVRSVFRRAAEVLGYACLTVRHLVDPDVIVLGGGVIEACGDYILPIVHEIIASDALPGARPGRGVVTSTLGDDAVALGAAALAQEKVGHAVWRDAETQLPAYPVMTETDMGKVTADGKTYRYDIIVRANGRIKRRNKQMARQTYGTSHEIGPEELKKVCKGDPGILIIGTGQQGQAALTAEARRLLQQRNIAVELMPTPMAIREYNRARGLKAAIIHVTC